MKLTEETKYEWCLKYCELYGLDPSYYRDWNTAEEKYLEFCKIKYGTDLESWNLNKYFPTQPSIT